MDYLLYRYQGSDSPNEFEPGIRGDIVDFPLFETHRFWGLVAAGRFEYLKTLVLAAWVALIGVAKASEFRIWVYLSSAGDVLHYSIVSPTNVHMPWLPGNEQGIEVGGCVTIIGARGQRIYPYVLRHVAFSMREGMPIYMIVESGNAASVAGMERAGFELVGRLCRKGSFGRPPRYENTQVENF